MNAQISEMLRQAACQTPASKNIYIGRAFVFKEFVTGDIIDIASRARDTICPDSKAKSVIAIMRERNSLEPLGRGFRTMYIKRADLSSDWRRLSEVRSLGVIHRAAWIVHSRPGIWCIQTPEGHALIDFTNKGIELNTPVDKHYICGDVDLPRVGELFRDN